MVNYVFAAMYIFLAAFIVLFFSFGCAFSYEKFFYYVIYQINTS